MNNIISIRIVLNKEYKHFKSNYTNHITRWHSFRQYSIYYIHTHAHEQREREDGRGKKGSVRFSPTTATPQLSNRSSHAATAFVGFEISLSYARNSATLSRSLIVRYIISRNPSLIYFMFPPFFPRFVHSAILGNSFPTVHLPKCTFQYTLLLRFNFLVLIFACYV